MSSVDNLDVNSVDDFFDNIADYEEDFSFIRNNESALNFAKKKALENNSNSSTNDNFEDVTDNWSETTVSTDIDADLEIAQIVATNLSKCVVMDMCDNGNFQRCNSDEKLRGLWQLIGTWQLDNLAVLQAGKDLNKLGAYFVEKTIISLAVDNIVKSIHGKY
ncbi:unnamed protein product [Rhizophagus irregularis]|nr:unnamed protein product [Rhizophagus irregularis]CAB5355614.1 unnamed protein product [Rhizophagus irregularis]